MFHLTTLSLSPSVNSDDDIASTIHVLGSSVPSTSSPSFAIGDRVAAMHKMLAPGGAYAEYAVAPASTTSKVPEKVILKVRFPFSAEDSAGLGGGE